MIPGTITECVRRPVGWVYTLDCGCQFLDLVKEREVGTTLLHQHPRARLGAEDVAPTASADEATISRLRQRVALLEAERENTRQALLYYDDAHGFAHNTGEDEGEDKCPEDDTCSCWYFIPLDDAMRPRE